MSETTAAIPQDIQSLSFEEALKELEELVRRMESGESGLEKSITDYERGAALKAHCEQLLRNARLKVEKIVAGDSGAITTEPANIEE